MNEYDEYLLKFAEIDNEFNSLNVELHNIVIKKNITGCRILRKKIRDLKKSLSELSNLSYNIEEINKKAKGKKNG